MWKNYCVPRWRTLRYGISEWTTQKQDQRDVEYEGSWRDKARSRLFAPK